MKKLRFVIIVIVLVNLLPVTACGTGATENHTQVPTGDTGILQAEQEAPDNIMPVPGGGPAYRANVHRQGEENPWPPIEVSEAYLGGGSDEAHIYYRSHIETAAGETRNNIIKAILPDKEVDSLSLYVDDVPRGITLTDGMQWSGPHARASVLVIDIAPDIAPGEYPLEIGLMINRKDYGTVTCKIKVIEGTTGQHKETIRLDQAKPYLILYEANLVNEDPSRSVGLWTIASEEADCFEEYAQTAIQAVLDLYNLYKRDFTSVRLIPKDGIEIAYAQANLAADGKGAAGMTGSAPAIEGYWKVRASIDPQLTEQEMAIAELWFDKLPDFPQHNPLSSSSYDAEALRQYIADALNIPYDEVQMPDLEMHEYELDQSFIDWTISFADSRTSGETGKEIALEPLWENVSIGEVGIRSDTARLCIIL